MEVISMVLLDKMTGSSTSIARPHQFPFLCVRTGVLTSLVYAQCEYSEAWPGDLSTC